MIKKIVILLTEALIYVLFATGCRIFDMKLHNQNKEDVYPDKELVKLEEDGLSISEIEELNKLNQDIQSEGIKQMISRDNEALLNGLLDIAVVNNIEDFCYEKDDILEGFNVELASSVAEYIGVDFQLFLENSEDDCFKNKDIDCVILNNQNNNIDGYQYSEEYTLDNGKNIIIAVKRDNDELLKVINQVLLDIKADGIINDLENRYID